MTQKYDNALDQWINSPSPKCPLPSDTISRLRDMPASSGRSEEREMEERMIEEMMEDEERERQMLEDSEPDVVPCYICKDQMYEISNDPRENLCPKCDKKHRFESIERIVDGISTKSDRGMLDSCTGILTYAGVPKKIVDFICQCCADELDRLGSTDVIPRGEYYNCITGEKLQGLPDKEEDSLPF